MRSAVLLRSQKVTRYESLRNAYIRVAKATGTDSECREGRG